MPAEHQATETHALVNHFDGMLAAVDTSRIERVSFFVDDIPFYITHKKNADTQSSMVVIQAILGYLPFSVEAQEKRQALLAILASTHALKNIRFGMDHHGRIFTAANFTTDTLTSPNFIFFPLTRFLQEARPFIDLIGQYL